MYNVIFNLDALMENSKHLPTEKDVPTLMKWMDDQDIIQPKISFQKDKNNADEIVFKFEREEDAVQFKLAFG